MLLLELKEESYLCIDGSLEARQKFSVAMGERQGQMRKSSNDLPFDLMTKVWERLNKGRLLGFCFFNSSGEN